MATSYLMFGEIGILLAVVALLDVVKELVRTLKRIEARIALANPIEEERKVFGEGSGFLTRTRISDRAMHPDVWIHQQVTELHGLTGAAYKEKRKMHRYTEQSRRN
jgi:hypothetical protein